jgi:hypothetical protein
MRVDTSAKQGNCFILWKTKKHPTSFVFARHRMFEILWGQKHPPHGVETESGKKHQTPNVKRV